MTPILAHRIELAVTPAQVDYFRRACGTARFIWNWALAEWNRQRALGLQPTALRLKKQFNAVKYDEFPWLEEIHRDAHSQPFANLARAWSRYFHEIKAKRAAHVPVFKRRGRCRDAFYVANDRLTLEERRVRLPVIGWVRIKEALRFGGRILGASVQRHADRWFLCVQVELGVSWLTKAERRPAVGVDLNVQAIVCSNGKRYLTPQPLKKGMRRLRIDQRSVSRKLEAAKRLDRPKAQSGNDAVDRPTKSDNCVKAIAKVAKRHHRNGCKRNDFLHKTTTELCRENQAVGIEGLNVVGMTASAAGTIDAPGRQVRQKAGRNRAILDVGFGEFRRLMTYKCERYGTDLVVADQWYPSSKLCSACGTKNTALTLRDRHWHCAVCGAQHDRDVNASINLERLATDKLQSALPKAMGKVTSVRHETGQKDDSGQKPSDRKVWLPAHICAHFG